MWLANAFLTPLAGPTTTNPLINSAIDAPHDSSLFQKIDHINRARILCQSKQILRTQAQDFSQSEANDPGVGDDKGASPLIRCDDPAYHRGYTLLELAEGLAAGNCLARKPLDP